MFKKGQKVWNICYGWGYIKDIIEDKYICIFNKIRKEYRFEDNYKLKDNIIIPTNIHKLQIANIFSISIGEIVFAPIFGFGEANSIKNTIQVKFLNGAEIQFTNRGTPDIGDGYYCIYNLIFKLDNKLRNIYIKGIVENKYSEFSKCEFYRDTSDYYNTKKVKNRVEWIKKGENKLTDSYGSVSITIENILKPHCKLNLIPPISLEKYSNYSRYHEERRELEDDSVEFNNFINKHLILTRRFEELGLNCIPMYSKLLNKNDIIYHNTIDGVPIFGPYSIDFSKKFALQICNLKILMTRDNKLEKKVWSNSYEWVIIKNMIIQKDFTYLILLKEETKKVYIDIFDNGKNILDNIFMTF